MKYRVIKNVTSGDRANRTNAFLRFASADPLRALFFAPGRAEPFAALHALTDDVS